jgi:hypothetical protein
MATRKTATINPFDLIAKPSTPAAAKKSDKVLADVTPDIMGKVDICISNKATIKRLEAEYAEAEIEVIDFVRPQQDKLAYDGQFTKSLLVKGNTGNLLYNTSDKFSAISDPAQKDAIKELLGKNYDNAFKNKRTVSILEKAQENTTFVTKLIALINELGMDMSETLQVTDSIIAKDDLDRNVYTFVKPKDLPTFRSLVKQCKPALK